MQLLCAALADALITIGLVVRVDVTGEEEEDVQQELKGVKLFIKRGNKPFASGMVGHLKLLSDRKTLKERLRTSLSLLSPVHADRPEVCGQSSDANPFGKCR